MDDGIPVERYEFCDGLVDHRDGASDQRRDGLFPGEECRSGYVAAIGCDGYQHVSQ